MPPKADFAISPAEGVVGEPLDFDASAASDDGKIVKYYWEFGDGTEAEGKKVPHTFTAPGTFEVTLWVTDDKGQTSSVTKPLVVK
ncbi:PKD domain-containing protein [bacterium]|nr:PKD domain-containing protein [bacterium]